MLSTQVDATGIKGLDEKKVKRMSGIASLACKFATSSLIHSNWIRELNKNNNQMLQQKVEEKKLRAFRIWIWMIRATNLKLCRLENEHKIRRVFPSKPKLFSQWIKVNQRRSKCQEWDLDEKAESMFMVNAFRI